MTQEELENAWCPEDYFAYNGLQFSKLEGKLTDKDLEGLDKAQLRIMRKEVYTVCQKTCGSGNMNPHSAQS